MTRVRLFGKTGNRAMAIKRRRGRDRPCWEENHKRPTADKNQKAASLFREAAFWSGTFPLRRLPLAS